MQKIDMTGKVIGRLTVIERAGADKNGQAKWLCSCECGNQSVVLGGNLRKGNTFSCGCLHKENTGNMSRKHGLSTTSSTSELKDEYGIWVAMNSRCNNPKHNGYELYGGRGIKVCDRWSDVSLFLQDMGSRPSKSHSIDRIDVNGNYEPDNCRWATLSEQSRNKRARKDNPSGYPGVTWDKECRKWRATITVNYKTINLSVYEDLSDAVKARKEAELKYWI